VSKGLGDDNESLGSTPAPRSADANGLVESGEWRADGDQRARRTTYADTCEHRSSPTVRADTDVLSSEGHIGRWVVRQLLNHWQLWQALLLLLLQWLRGLLLLLDGLDLRDRRVVRLRVRCLLAVAI